MPFFTDKRGRTQRFSILVLWLGLSMIGLVEAQMPSNHLPAPAVPVPTGSATNTPSATAQNIFTPVSDSYLTNAPLTAPALDKPTTAETASPSAANSGTIP